MGGGPEGHPVAPPAPGVPLGPPDLIRGGPQQIPRPSAWRLGGPAPWAHLEESSRRPSLAEIRRAIGAAPRGSPLSEHLKREAAPTRSSAVLAAIYELDETPHVLLTRRSWSMRAHGGEISFPGGREEAGDPDLVATALRESYEEVGIEPATVEVIGQLDELATLTSQSKIVPYVGILPGVPDVRPDPREVEEIRHVALSELLSPHVYREEIWYPEGMERTLWFFELHGDTVWGATAAMLRQLLSLITGTWSPPPPSTAH